MQFERFDEDLSVNGSHAKLRGVGSGGGGGGWGGGGVVKALVPPRWISLNRHSAAAQVQAEQPIRRTECDSGGNQHRKGHVKKKSIRLHLPFRFISKFQPMGRGGSAATMRTL